MQIETCDFSDFCPFLLAAATTVAAAAAAAVGVERSIYLLFVVALYSYIYIWVFAVDSMLSVTWFVCTSFCCVASPTLRPFPFVSFQFRICNFLYIFIYIYICSLTCWPAIATFVCVY